MQASLYHVQVNVADPAAAIPFYRELFAFLGHEVVDESPEHLGVTDGTASVWIVASDPGFAEPPFHRKRPGLNHLAFRVGSPEDVDRFVAEFLAPRGIETLYGSPKAFPDYAPTYYAAFFEGPDRLKLEIAFP